MTDEDSATVLGPIGTLLEQAYSYAGMGFEVFPANPTDKTPLVSQYKATTDLDTIEAWWKQWPDALIGHRISPDQIILDIDPRHGGDQTWAALLAEMPVLHTRTHFSGRHDNGHHVWLLRPADHLTITGIDQWAKERGLGQEMLDGEGRSTGRWVSGIDLLHHKHRYTILPPSHHPETGRPYYWGKGRGWNILVAPPPQLLVDLLVRDDVADVRAPDTGPKFIDPTSIADTYSQETSWTELLRRHHWTLVGGDGGGDGSRWRHPEATSAVSATIKHGCLFVYSPNTPFEVTYPDDPKGYTPFRAFAVLEHQNDLSAAGRAAREMFPCAAGTEEPGDPETRTNGHGDRVIRRTKASQIAPKRARWAWDKRLPVGAISLLAGPEGLGKSTVVVDTGARLTRGALPGEFYGTPKVILANATEDSWAHTIVPRFMAAGADLGLVEKLEVELEEDITTGLTLPVDLAGLEDIADETEAAMLILDPLMSRLDPRLDAHRDGEVRRALEPLSAMAERTGLVIWGLIHHNKSGSSDPLSLVMASKAFTAVARTVHTVVKDPDDEAGARRYFGIAKSNLGPTDLPSMSFTIEPWTFPTDDGEGETGRLVWGTEVCESIGDLLARGNQAPEQKTAQSEANEWLGEYMQAHGGEVWASEAKAAGKAAGHTVTAIERASVHHKIIKGRDGFQTPYRWKLSSPSNGPQDPEVDEVDEVALTRDATSQHHQPRQTGLSPRARDEVEESDPLSVSCRFIAGSLYCANDHCPNPNHRSKP